MTTSKNAGNSASPVAWEMGTKANGRNIKRKIRLIRGSQGYSKDFHCPLHKTPKPLFHHHFRLTSGRIQFHFLLLFLPQLTSVSDFLRLTTILVTVFISGTKYLIETNNERKDLS